MLKKILDIPKHSDSSHVVPSEINFLVKSRFIVRTEGLLRSPFAAPPLIPGNAHREARYSEDNLALNVKVCPTFNVAPHLISPIGIESTP